MVGAILWPQIGHPLHEHMSKLVFPLQRHISTQFVCSGGKHFVKWVAALTLALWPGHSDVPSALLLGPWPAVATYGIGSEWSSWHDSALQCTHSHKKNQVSCTCTYIRYITYRRPYHTTHTHQVPNSICNDFHDVGENFPWCFSTWQWPGRRLWDTWHTPN